MPSLGWYREVDVTPGRSLLAAIRFVVLHLLALGLHVSRGDVEGPGLDRVAMSGRLVWEHLPTRW